MTLLDQLIQQLQDYCANLSDDQHAQILALLQEGQMHASPTWSAHMTPAVSPYALLGHILAASHNGNLLSAPLYPQLATIESEVIHWFCRHFQLPFGHFIQGGSYANLEALWQVKTQARDTHRPVYVSQAAHYSIVKACHILDLPYQIIPSDDQDRLQIPALRQACQDQPPLAIVATAGTPSCGAIDPLDLCAAIAQQYACWYHIDAAWGGMLALVEHADIRASFSLAHSLSFDPHKALEQSKPCSILLYRQSFPIFHEVNTDYLHAPPEYRLGGSYGGELFLPVWCSLFHEETLIAHIQQRLAQAAQFAQQLAILTDWQIWPAVTGIVCFKPNSDMDLSPLVQQGILSQTLIHDIPVYRAVFASHHTQAEAMIAALQPYF